MTRAAVRKAILADYAALSRAADTASGGAELLRKALNASAESERIHRRMGGGLGKYSQSVATAAAYFCVKWYREPAKVRNALDAASLRLDCLYASALRALLDNAGSSPKCYASEAVDYSEHIAA